MTTAIVYIPVFHEGYRQFFAETKPDQVWVLNRSMMSSQFEYLRKDIRALAAVEIIAMLEALKVAPVIDGLHTQAEIVALITESPSTTRFVVTDDEIGRWIEQEFLDGKTVARYTPFLRWDTAKATAQQTIVTKKITADAVQKMFALADVKAQQSSDWWRQVGAAVAKDGRLLLSAHNTHLPTEHEPYFSGDGRALFHKGEHIDTTSAIHAEAKVVAQAARQGIPLEGAEMFVTTFPCPPCAKLIATAGITKLYFREGYALFDGETILKTAGVEIIRVE